ncbi:hypothetical protein BGZ63DRAFT_82590 [Mariannaea sp. PMI_226]|nr:hypothetical protein BGZ63DRAFT_82590 [Mariannaea sp. PMI_226]
MPRPNNPLPQFLPPLHLYRHLLRECSYLPPTWRQTISDVVRKRYRRHRKHDPKGVDPDTQLVHAKQALGNLRLMNEGHKDVALKLLRKAYGRTGPRRRKLMSNLVLPDSPTNSDALDKLLIKSNTPTPTPEESPKPTQNSQSKRASKASKASKNAFHTKWDKEKLRQFARSQHNQEKLNSNIWLHGDLKVNDERQYVPKSDIWGNRPCQALVITKVGKFWRKVVPKVMPPLEKHEWNQISLLSAGGQAQFKEWMVPKRRQPAVQVATERHSNGLGWDWESYADFRANYINRGTSPKMALRTGQRQTGPYQQDVSKKELSSRWYRRAYTRLWQITPTVDQDPHTLKKQITWGTPGKLSVPARKSQMEFLSGSNEKKTSET